MTTALSTFTGSDGSAWSPEWVLGTSTGASTAVLNSNRGRMTLSQAGSYTDRMTQRLVAAGQWADVIMRGTVEFPNLTSENFGQAWVRAGTNIQADGYFVSLSPFYGDVGLYKRVGGTQTQLGSSVAFGWAANTPTSWLIEAVGTTIRCKVWTGSEPGGYTISQTDTSHSSGWLGLSLDGGASTVQPYVAYWDNVEYPGPIRRPAVFADKAAGRGVEQLRAPRDVIVVRPRAGGPATNDVSITSTLASTIAATRGTTAGATVSAGLAVTAAADVAAVAASTPITCRLEIELTAGVWTDITPFVSYRSGPVRIRQGRPTEYDEVGPGVMTLQLWNDDGRFMPGNTGSPLYPNFTDGKRVRWLVDKGGETYTRFVGWIQAIVPEFPDSSTTGSVVGIVATDALGLLQQKKLRSNFTETIIWRARLDSVLYDVHEASGEAAGYLAITTNYSTDPGRGACAAAYSASAPTLSFTEDRDASLGGVVSSQGGTSCTTFPLFQDGHLQFLVHVKGPSSQVSATPQGVLSFFTISGAVPVCHLQVRQSGGSNGVYLRNAANTADLGIVGDLPFGQWVRIIALARVDNPARSDWGIAWQDFSTGSGLYDVNIDVRTIRQVEMPGSAGPKMQGMFGGVAGMATRTGLDLQESFVGGSRTIALRIGHLNNATANLQLPGGILTHGTLSGNVATGRWSGRSALEVLQEMMRTVGGIAWAWPGNDGSAYCIGPNVLYPTTVVATIDTDGDCIGSPQLLQGTESQPTRVDVEWTGAVATVFNAAAESSGAQRSKRITTVAPDAATAATAGQRILDRAVGGLRISSIEVDLMGADTDHAPALLSESTTLGGLYPTARYRLPVPVSHFGVPTRDVHVQGWAEAYGPNVASIRMDTSPAIASTLASETWPGANGAAWSGQWSAASGGGVSGATIDTQSGRGRILPGGGGDVWRRITAVSAADVEVTGLVQVQGSAEAQVWWRIDSSRTNGYALVFSAASGVRVQQMLTGSIGTRHIVSPSSKYGVGFYGANVYGGTTGILASTDYRYRIRHQGAYLSIRVWPAAVAEPGTWTMNVIDTLHAGPGYVALGQWYAGQTALFDDLTITTGA